MRPTITHNLFCFCYLYISFLLLSGAQSASTRKLAIVDDKAHNEKLLFPPRRRLEDILISCSTACLREISEYVEKDSLLVNLGPSANYTLIFPIPADAKDFTLLFNPAQDVGFSVSLEKPLSNKYVPFNDYLIKEGEWMKLFIYGEVLSEYKGGKTILELSNLGAQSTTTTVKFSEESYSTSIGSGVILFLILGACVYIPILGCLFVLISAMVRKMYNLYWCRKNHRNQPEYHGDFPNQLEYSDIHVHVAEEGAYGTHRALESGRQDQIINLASMASENGIANKGNHNTISHTRDYYARNLPLNAETISYHFPEIKFENLQSPFSHTICSVCLEELNTEAICRQLYCQHVFHSECIKLWLENQLLKKKACCPNCNADMRLYQY